MFERVSVARDYEILAEALRHGRGRIETAELKGALATQEFSGEILREGSEIATTQSLARERDMIARVNRGVGNFAPLGTEVAFIASDRLRPEQKRAVDFVLKSRDRAVGISGAAGAGKTATLQELRRGLQEARREVMAIAPTMSAVEELQRVGFSNAVTLERLLCDLQMQSSMAGSVIVLDEAGMVSGRQMSELLELAERKDARLVFCGDTRQIQSVEACDALRVLEKESRLKSVALTEVQRQTNREYRSAIQELRRDPEKGFQTLERIGAIREVPWSDRAAAVAAAFNEAQMQSKTDGAAPSVLVICATHEEIDRVTEELRARRKESGKLGAGHRIARDVSLGWTTAQKRDYRNFRAGQILEFHRAVKGVDKNEALEVVDANEKGIVVRNARGERHSVTRKQARCFDVLERQAIDVAAGDRLLLTGNRRQAEFRATNGEIVTVDRIDREGRICLDDGRVVPRDYTHVAHGYAVTAHRSQGKTVDAVIVSGDGMRRELFYVAASRGRDSVTVITSDVESLRASVASSTARQSATELARKALVKVERGVRRGFSAARDLVQRSRTWPAAIRKEPLQRKAPDWRTPPAERAYEHGISR